MTRKRVTASEKKQRHEWAVRQIERRNGSQRINLPLPKHGVLSPRIDARDVVAAAHKDWLDACYGSEEIDQRDLLFQQVGRLERIARNEKGPFSAAVGAITALAGVVASILACHSSHSSANLNCLNWSSRGEADSTSVDWLRVHTCHYVAALPQEEFQMDLQQLVQFFITS